MKLKYLKGEFHEGLQRGEVPIRNMILMKLRTDNIKRPADQLKTREPILLSFLSRLISELDMAFGHGQTEIQ